MKLIYLTLIIFIVTALAQKKPGSCPPNVQVSECKYTCFSDKYCEGNLKCCRTQCGGTTCLQPVTSRLPGSNKAKPGHCSSNPTGPWVCSNRCSVDGDCRGKRKCCKNRCGAMECAIPLDYDDTVRVK
ncbi:whey acdic protein wap [Holotrichia oblita]|uniref:Whey acdic protein wap n=2 Tax=Holotrichia oblita TaxID=644536 RepID=A0ACB9T078_HOLOL|nr:whey acdic protein wap [Holotrichia oblita]KAI4460228.1 whey acdic protein wap [Holotrichia oblita]